jgi:hypothetical protein
MAALNEAIGAPWRGCSSRPVNGYRRWVLAKKRLSHTPVAKSRDQALENELADSR